MKKTCFTVFFAFLIAGVSLFSLEQTDTAKKQAIIQKFDPDLCQNGYAGSWTGACICFDGYHGKYCEKKKNLALLRERERERERERNNSLKSTSYTNKKSFKIVLSDEIFSHTDAIQFCQSLGKNWTLANRNVFNCKQTGINCLDKKLFGHIKQRYGHRGFFWLEETADKQNAYYADLNDGTVYLMNKFNHKTAQALCFFER